MELAAAAPGEGPGTHPALVDARVRWAVLSAARRGPEAAYAGDRSDGGAANAPACAACGGPTRCLGRGDAPVESAPGRVEVPTGRYACDACGTGARPRERALDIVGSMTPAGRRMASLAGSSCCYAEADRLLAETRGRGLRGEGASQATRRRRRHGIERTTRAVGDDVESRREAALWGALSVAVPGSGGTVPARKP